MAETHVTDFPAGKCIEANALCARPRTVRKLDRGLIDRGSIGDQTENLGSKRVSRICRLNFDPVGAVRRSNAQELGEEKGSGKGLSATMWLIGNATPSYSRR